jgi:signal transduction histidine kinase
MSVHEPAHAGRAPLRRAALIGLAAAAVLAAAWAWAVMTAPSALRHQVVFGGAGAAVLCCAAAVIAAYYAAAARGARDTLSHAGADASRLERELAQLLEETLPALLQRIPAGAPIDGMLADLPRPESGGLRRLLDTVARELAAAQRRAAAAMAAYAAVEQDAARLAETELPELARLVREGEPVDAVLSGARRPAGDALPRLMDGATREIAAAQRRGAAAMAACASAAARVQAQTARMLADLRRLQDAYSDATVFADLMELDHAVSQLGRLADGIALLSGGRSGRRWTKPIVMESILRGALGRIDGYRRIRLNSTSTAAVAGYAAEGVMHALAELMDNAAAFSAHGSAVQVYVEEEDAGVVITIEDSGLGMRKRERERAERLVSEALDLSRLPGTRLGLAVVWPAGTA